MLDLLYSKAKEGDVSTSQLGCKMAYHLHRMYYILFFESHAQCRWAINGSHSRAPYREGLRAVCSVIVCVLRTVMLFAAWNLSSHCKKKIFLFFWNCSGIGILGIDRVFCDLFRFQN